MKIKATALALFLNRRRKIVNRSRFAMAPGAVLVCRRVGHIRKNFRPVCQGMHRVLAPWRGQCLQAKIRCISLEYHLRKSLDGYGSKRLALTPPGNLD